MVLVGTLLGACALGDTPRPAERHEVRPGGPGRATVLAVGERVPDFVAPDIRGGLVRWRDRAGSPTVLVVWAAWCPHCRRLLPPLVRVAPEFPGVQVLTVTTSIGRRPGPTPGDVIERDGLSFPVALDDADNTLARALGVFRYPTLYWVGRDGAVRGVSEGEAGEVALRQAFAALARAP
jgi:peroxiredoxin